MRKAMLVVTSALMLTLVDANPAVAQDWPQKPIRIIVSFGPGGGADIIGRIVADSMQGKLGKPVVIENKPGAGGILGNEAVANAEPDGHTLGIMTAGQIIAAVTRKNMRYDTLTAFAPIGQIATASLLIVTRPDFPAKNVKELVAAAKAEPGRIVFASPGFAATQHFAGELFKQTAKINLLHVPFKTSPEAINAILGKHADVLFDTVSALIGHVHSGQLKALAVTGKDRFPAVPDVPAVIESGLLPGYDVTTWYGFFAPQGTPTAVIARLNQALNESIVDESARDRLVAAGVVVTSSTPQAFGDFMASEYKRWDAVREAAGIDKQ
ncbi:MAG TPA: tripartite tricarboxylate transporter substrate binding protein [Pseudolabrys sp.]|jgi:tripartite-type tricarboxylate transporter receptor subunit TctC|nr:tripartite tricarboxylate transporter substrate binding protein [Pseudolabrys sp.]